MKKSILLTFIFAIALTASSFAQLGLSGNYNLPDAPEDISPLLVGEALPNTTLKTPDNKSAKLHDYLKEKASVVVVYRGGWCPYCNAQLQELQEIEPDILKLGYNIIAISPDQPENLQTTDSKHDLNYQLLSDSNLEFITQTGLAFNAARNRTLPVPTVFVVDTDGTILFEYINPNYKTRLTGKLLKAVLENIDK